MSAITEISGLTAHINTYLATNSPPDNVLTEAYTVRITQYVREVCAQFHVAVSDDPVECQTSFRICLTAMGHKCDYNLPIVRASNGLILDIKQELPSTASAAADQTAHSIAQAAWKCYPLVLPPGDINHRSGRAASAHLSCYDIYPVYDGTVLNLYHYNGWWCVGSRKKCHVDDNLWRDFTYKEVLLHALSKYTKFSFDKLDTNCFYTIGYTHPAHHPFGNTKVFTREDLSGPITGWNVAVWLVKTNSAADPFDLGIDIPQPVTPTFMVMDSYNARAMQLYREGGAAHFGYVLRAKPASVSVTGAHSDVILHSDLYNVIKSVFYQVTRAPKLKIEKYQDYFRDIEFALILGYVDINLRSSMTLLFPQYADRIDKIARNIAMVARMICRPEARDPNHVAFGAYKTMSAIIGREYNPTGNINDNKIVANLLCNVGYADIYYENFKRVIDRDAGQRAVTLSDFIKVKSGGLVAAAANAPAADVSEVAIVVVTTGSTSANDTTTGSTADTGGTSAINTEQPSTEPPASASTTAPEAPAVSPAKAPSKPAAKKVASKARAPRKAK